MDLWPPAVLSAARFAFLSAFFSASTCCLPQLTLGDRICLCFPLLWLVIEFVPVFVTVAVDRICPCFPLLWLVIEFVSVFRYCGW